MFTRENYGEIPVGSILKDVNLGCTWKCLSNDGKTAVLKNVNGLSKNGAIIKVSRKTCSMTFVGTEVQDVSS